MVEYLFKAHPTTYRGIRFRSRLEATWAAFFDLLEWQWEYEPFDLKGWVPDFLIKGNGHDVLVEVKPITTPNVDVIDKIAAAADRKYPLLLCGVSPSRSLAEELDYFISIDSSCECEHVQCKWRKRFVAKINGKYDIVFGHWPAYVGFVTGICVSKEIESGDEYDPYVGDDVFMLWGKAKNKTQWRPA